MISVARQDAALPALTFHEVRDVADKTVSVRAAWRLSLGKVLMQSAS